MKPRALATLVNTHPYLARDLVFAQAPPVGLIRSKQQERKDVQALIDDARSQIFSLRAQVAERRKVSKETLRVGLKEKAGELDREIYALGNRQAKLQADMLSLANRASVLDREIEVDIDRFNRNKVDM